MTIGSLCSGVGGADLAAEALGFGPLAWYSEIDRDACKAMEARWPGVPNLGDLTAVEWERVPPGGRADGRLPLPAVLAGREAQGAGR